MKNKEFEVEVSFVFKGKFLIKAESQEQANEYAEKHCGLVLGRDIHSSLPDEDVNWDFPTHPDKIIHTIDEDLDKELEAELSCDTIDVLQHEVSYTYHDDWDGKPTETDIEYLEGLIKEGYNQGELHTLEDDCETVHSGWWKIL